MSTDPGPPDLPVANGTRSASDDARIQVVIAELTRMIARDLDLRIEESAIEPTGPLLDGGLMLDSMVLFEFIALIEKRYGVSFDTERLNTETFGSVSVLAEHIVGMQSGGEGG